MLSLIPKTCEYVTLHGKRDFVVSIKYFEMANYPELSGCAQYNQKGPYKREARGFKDWKADVLKEEVGEVICLEDRSKSQKPRNAGGR